VTTYLFLRQTLAEWKPVSVLIRRTRLPFWLSALTLGAVALGGLWGGASLPTLVTSVALLATFTSAAVLAGPQSGRATAMTLRHPASPIALPAGRWLAVTVLAGLVTLGAGIGAAWQAELGWREGVGAAASAGWVALPVVASGVLVTAAWWRRRTP
jgi:hypothetical protein